MSSDTPRATVGVIGGSGLYTFLDGADDVDVDTPWGAPSDRVAVGRIDSRGVAFLARHGREHTIPPHRINYRANLWALRSLGVERVVAPCAAGSLHVAHAPGSVVVCDQLINLSGGRAATYFDGPRVAHLSAPDPYCEELRPLAATALGEAGLVAHLGGTVAVVDGPRFSTRAESRMLAALGADVVNMTQYPEVFLARELGMCYVNLSVVTDYDSGLAGAAGVPPVTQEEVFAVFHRSTDALRDALHRLVAAVPASRGCGCAAAPSPIGLLP